MSTLIFDIETVGEKWSDFDGTTKSVLTRWIDKTARDEIDGRSQLEDLKNSLGFSPLTGYVVAIGVYDLERDQGAVYYQADELTDIETEQFVYKSRTETQMLADFWEGAKNYDTFVSFNGRQFDVPFLLHRSIANGIVPTVDLMKKRYLSQQTKPFHIDLQDELTFYGAMHRRPSLHLFCRAYGIDSPKVDVGGDDVAELFAEKKFRDIAEYNALDVIATKKLYEKWLEYLKK